MAAEPVSLRALFITGVFSRLSNPASKYQDPIRRVSLGGIWIQAAIAAWKKTSRYALSIALMVCFGLGRNHEII